VVLALFDGILTDDEASRFSRLMYSRENGVSRSGAPLSDSEPDFQLLLLVSLGTRDPAQLERIARTSVRCRPKWDERRGDGTLLQYSIAHALLQSWSKYLDRHAQLRRERAKAAAASVPGLRGYSDLGMLALPDPAWVIEGLLPAGGLVEVVGRYGAGKTFLFIDWLMHVAAGMDWQGRAVQRGGPCLYVYGEGAMKPRVAAWRSAHHTPPDAVVGVTYVAGTVNLLNPESVTAFLAQVDAGELGPRPVVVALDTLSRMAPGDENSPEYGAAVVASCDRIQRATGAAVVLGHHTPWDPNSQRPKGSSKVPDCADAVFLLANQDGALKLTCQKMRDGEPPPVQHLKLTPQDGALVIDKGTPSGKQGPRLSGEKKKVLNALKPGMRFSEWRDEYGGKPDTFKTEVARLKALGLVTQDGEHGPWSPVQFEVEQELAA
jgi:hypothetical protein